MTRTRDEKGNQKPLPATPPLPIQDDEWFQEAASARAPASNLSTKIESPRRRFFVELKHSETTTVSLKDLVPLATRANIDTTPIDTNLAPDESGTGARQNPLRSRPDRFTGVIGRIDRIYRGPKSDEEGSKEPDSDEYDTSDSFIDDSELPDYSTAGRSSKTKQHGFYIHRGQLEPDAATSAVAKKRKRNRNRKVSSLLETSEAANTGKTPRKQKREAALPGCVPLPLRGKPKPGEVTQQSDDQALAGPTKANTRVLRSGTAAASIKRMATELEERVQAKPF